MRLAAIVPGVLAATLLSGSPMLARADTGVAFVNVAADPASAKKAITSLRATAFGLGLVPPAAAGPNASALEDPLGAEPAPGPALERSRVRLAEAKDAFFNYEYALAKIARAEAELLSVAPSAEAHALLSDINILLGRIHHEHGQPDRAIDALRLARRLKPERKVLDPGAYGPKVLKLYAKAMKATPASSSLRIESLPAGATVLVDGSAVGTTPLDLPGVEMGDHYVFLTKVDHEPKGIRLELGIEVSATSVSLTEVPVVEAVRATRRRLAGSAPGASAWKRAGARLARLTSVRAVVLVRGKGTFEVALYDADEETLGAWVPLDAPRAVRAMLSAVAAGRGGHERATKPPRKSPGHIEPPPKKKATSGLTRGVLIGVGASLGAALIAGSVFLIVAVTSTPTYVIDTYTWAD